MHPVWALMLITFVLVLGFLAWNRISVERHKATGGGHTDGIGGPDDPMAGSRKLDRSPEEMRRALDDAWRAGGRVRAQG